MDSVFIVGIALFAGILTHSLISQLIEEKKANYSPFLYCLFYILLWASYNHFVGIRHFFFLGFLFFLTILFFTDLIECSVSDHVVLIGVLYCLAWQLYYNNLFTALAGGVNGLTIGILLYYSGHFLYPSREKNLDQENTAEFSNDFVYMPFVPCLYMAVLWHMYSSFHLVEQLLAVQRTIQEQALLSYLLEGSSIILLIYLTKKALYEHKHNEPVGRDIAAITGQEEDSPVAFGDGDITTFILIGVTFGWQALCSIVFVAFLLSSFIGGILLGKRKWHTLRRKSHGHIRLTDRGHSI